MLAKTKQKKPRHPGTFSYTTCEGITVELLQKAIHQDLENLKMYIHYDPNILLLMTYSIILHV